jgi:predicted ATPase/DNA-binding SARP family transcriptional activator
MRFRVLGPVLVSTEDGPVAITAPKQRTLLAALLVARQPVSAQRLIDELWPEGAPSTAIAALQVYVSELRKTLGSDLTRSAAGYHLDVPASDVDSYQFETLLADGSATALAEALALWRGPAFDGVTLGPDTTAAAVRLTELRLTAREKLARQALAAGGHAEIIPDLTGWVAEQPTGEVLVGLLMLALYRAGRPGDAVQAYERLAEQCQAQLGMAPGEEVERLLAAIRRQDPTLANAGPGLPASRSRFIGRRAELDRIAELLGECRLLTVVGPGGCGKTRLSYELVREVAGDYPDGVHVVELAGFRSTVDVPVADDRLTVEALTARVAAVVGAREIPGQSVSTSLASHLASNRVLLLLDNCEHVRQPVVAMVHDLLVASPGLRVLATSREPLGLPAEVVFRLGGLALPAQSASAREVETSDAVRLFADRVVAARGGARWRPDEEPEVVEICRRLDGLPLALELAASRLRGLSVREVVSRLDAWLDLLVGTSPVDRHQTMRNAIGWSHDLLEPAQQVLLRRLSVFAGGFDLPAAEQVGADPAGAPPCAPGEVLDPLVALVERSMVDRRDAPDLTSRYQLIETNRQYAAERLTREGGPQEARAAARRHGEVYAQMLAPAPPADGPAHAVWLARVRLEQDNVRLALERALIEEETDLALNLATSMWWYWWVTGQMLEGRSWLDRVLKATTGEVSPGRGRALRAAASLARNSGDLAAARRIGEEALSVFRQLDLPAGIISALNNLSITAQGQRDYDASLAFGYEGLALAESVGDGRAIAAAMNNTAGTLRCLGRLDDAAELFDRALAGFRRMSDRRGEAAALFNMATVDRRQGRFGSARQRYQTALDLYTELDIVEGQLDAVEGLAHLAAIAGHHRPALLALLVCDRQRSRMGTPLFTPDELDDRASAEELARSGLTEVAIAEIARAAESCPVAEVAAAVAAYA